MLKKNKISIRKILGKNFSKKDKSEFYFVKGLKQFSETIVVKTKQRVEGNKISQTKAAFWNDQFKIIPPLTPNHVKALIATESGFKPDQQNPNNPPRIGPARGLMQITVDTQKRLSGKNKELTNQFVILLDEDIYDPNKNICAGIRWLFRKRETAKARLKRDPTWEEVLMEFKGRLKSKSEETKEIKIKLNNYLRELNEK